MPEPSDAPLNSSTTPARSAAALGYRMPAEWEPQDAVWVTPPHNAETWPGCLPEAREQFDAFLDVLKRFVTVRTTDDVGIETNDSWVRDFGPLFVTRKPDTPHVPTGSPSAAGTPRPSPLGPRSSALGLRPTAHGPRPTPHAPPLPPLACHDFIFNGWGGKYETRDLDNAVPRGIARHLNIPLWEHGIVLEGGSIDVNGRGTVMTTEQCLLNPNRNPDLSKDQIEKTLHECLGTAHAIWLPGGIIGDDTDGHVDTLARFCDPGTIAYQACDDRQDAHYEELRAMADELAAFRDPYGKPYRLAPLPLPEPIHDDDGRRLPAGYPNFLIVNGAVLVPTYGCAQDAAALERLRPCFPTREVIGIDCRALIHQYGSLHCVTMQIPKAP